MIFFYFWFEDVIIHPIRGAFPRIFFKLATMSRGLWGLCPRLSVWIFMGEADNWALGIGQLGSIRSGVTMLPYSVTICYRPADHFTIFCCHLLTARVLVFYRILLPPRFTILPYYVTTCYRSTQYFTMFCYHLLPPVSVLHWEPEFQGRVLPSVTMLPPIITRLRAAGGARVPGSGVTICYHPSPSGRGSPSSWVGCYHLLSCYHLLPPVSVRQGEPEFLGRAVATPTVHLDPSKAKPPPLKWYSFTKGDRADAGGSGFCSVTLRTSVPELTKLGVKQTLCI